MLAYNNITIHRSQRGTFNWSSKLSLSKLAGKSIKDIKNFFRKKYFWIIDVLSYAYVVNLLGLQGSAPETQFTSACLQSMQPMNMKMNILNF